MGKNSARRGFRSSNNKSGRARDFAREGEILDDAHNRTARAVTGAAEHRASCVTTTTTPAKQKSTKFTTKSEENYRQSLFLRTFPLKTVLVLIGARVRAAGIVGVLTQGVCRRRSIVVVLSRSSAPTGVYRSITPF